MTKARQMIATWSADGQTSEGWSWKVCRRCYRQAGCHNEYRLRTWGRINSSSGCTTDVLQSLFLRQGVPCENFTGRKTISG